MKRYDMHLEGHVIDVTDPKNPKPFHDFTNAYRDMPEGMMVEVQQLAVASAQLMTKIGEVKARDGKDAASAYIKTVLGALSQI